LTTSGLEDTFGPLPRFNTFRLSATFIAVYNSLQDGGTLSFLHI
jgi:hypothetical protein